MLTIIKILVVFCVAESRGLSFEPPLKTTAESVHTNAMPKINSKKIFTSVEDSVACSRGYEPITSTWQACKAAVARDSNEKGNIVFVDGSGRQVDGKKKYMHAKATPGCYWNYNNGLSYRTFCRLKKG